MPTPTYQIVLPAGRVLCSDVSAHEVASICSDLGFYAPRVLRKLPVAACVLPSHAAQAKSASAKQQADRAGRRKRNHIPVTPQEGRHLPVVRPQGGGTQCIDPKIGATLPVVRPQGGGLDGLAGQWRPAP